MASIHSIQKSFADFIVEFENLKKENEKLKKFIKELSKEAEVKFAKFFDLTFLYPGHFPGCVEHNIEEEYHNIIKKHIYENKHKFNDGDIIFIGDTYETRQEYGFATIQGNIFIIGEYPPLTPGVYYRDAIDEINKFWNEFNGDDFYEEHDIKTIKEDGLYEP